MTEVKTYNRTAAVVIEDYNGGGDDALVSLVKIVGAGDSDADLLSATDFDAKIGSVTETAPATDTASSGLNGRLQRVAQRLTSLIAQLPASLGIKADAASLSVALSTEQRAILAAVATEVTLAALSGKLPASLGIKADAASLSVGLSTEQRAILAAVATEATLAAQSAKLPSSLGIKTPANALATVAAGSATPTVGQVGDSASSVTLIASNANRRGAAVYNDSTAILRVKCGATASASSFTAALAGKTGSIPGGYWEAPAGYTGIIDGIWDSDAGGNASTTELV